MRSRVNRLFQPYRKCGNLTSPLQGLRPRINLLILLIYRGYIAAPQWGELGGINIIMSWIRECDGQLKGLNL